MSVQNSSFIGPVFQIKFAGALVSPFGRRQTKKFIYLLRYERLYEFFRVLQLVLKANNIIIIIIMQTNIFIAVVIQMLGELLLLGGSNRSYTCSIGVTRAGSRYCMD